MSPPQGGLRCSAPGHTPARVPRASPRPLLSHHQPCLRGFVKYGFCVGVNRDLGKVLAFSKLSHLRSKTVPTVQILPGWADIEAVTPMSQSFDGSGFYQPEPCQQEKALCPCTLSLQSKIRGHTRSVLLSFSFLFCCIFKTCFHLNGTLHKYRWHGKFSLILIHGKLVYLHMQQ